MQECVQNIRNNLSPHTKIIGIEITKSSINVESTNDIFCGDVVFVMGNEGQGMNEKQMSVCDDFVKISQYGGGMASLNVSVATSIVLHRFYTWAWCDDGDDL